MSSAKAAVVVSGVTLASATATGVFTGLVACNVSPFIIPKERFALAVSLLAGATLALAVIGCMCYATRLQGSVQDLDAKVEDWGAKIIDWNTQVRGCIENWDTRTKNSVKTLDNSVKTLDNKVSGIEQILTATKSKRR